MPKLYFVEQKEVAGRQICRERGMGGDNCVIVGEKLANAFLTRCGQAGCNVGEPSCQQATVQVLCTEFSPSDALEQHSCNWRLQPDSGGFV